MKKTYNTIHDGVFDEELITSNPHCLFVYDTTLVNREDDPLFQFWNTFAIPTKISATQEFLHDKDNIGESIIDRCMTNLRYLSSLKVFERFVFSKYFGNNLDRTSHIFKELERGLNYGFNIEMKEDGLDFIPKPI